jgi:hypothetical protein
MIGSAGLGCCTELNTSCVFTCSCSCSGGCGCCCCCCCCCLAVFVASLLAAALAAACSFCEGSPGVSLLAAFAFGSALLLCSAGPGSVVGCPRFLTGSCNAGPVLALFAEPGSAGPGSALLLYLPAAGGSNGSDADATSFLRPISSTTQSHTPRFAPKLQ